MQVVRTVKAHLTTNQKLMRSYKHSSRKLPLTPEKVPSMELQQAPWQPYLAQFSVAVLVPPPVI